MKSAGAKAVAPAAHGPKAGAGRSPEQAVFGAKQAAAYLGISKDKLLELAKKGDLPSFRIGTRWKFRKYAVDGWMAQREAGQKVQGRRG